MVEFALLLPIFVMLVLGLFSGGLAYNQKLQLTHAAREGARYGATLDEDQTFTPATTWAQAVRNVVVQRSAGDLEASRVCIALVEGGSGGAAIGADWTTDGGNGNCFGSGSFDKCNQNDNSAAGSFTGRRVHVCVWRDGYIELGVFPRINLTLTSSSSTRFEG